jgi:hypothetical protein
MANLRPQRLSPPGLGPTTAPAVPPARRKLRLAIGALAAIVVLALAWFDGGERALRPIAEPVALPEQGQ